MKPLKSLISWEEGKKLLFSHLHPVEEKERVPLKRANQRVLAEDIVASFNVPPFNRAAMDGYAVRAEDTYPAKSMNPVRLKVKDFLPPGKFSKAQVRKGECIQIATGSPLPRGADAVVMVEDTEMEEGVVKIYRPVYPGANVSLAGEDIKRGEKVGRVEDFLTPAKIGVLAALGKEEVEVFVKPRVIIMSSGEEIVSPGEPLQEGKIYDVNSFTLSALVEENGCEAILGPRLRDEIDHVIQKLRKALSADLVIISGGSSVGEKDLIKEALSRMGEILFHGLAVKPGKPTLASIVEGKLVLGMPGYPTSCLTNGYGLLIPLLRRLARLPRKKEVVVKLSLSRRVTSTIGRHQFLPVRIEENQAVPVFKESGAITSMSQAQGYIEIPATVDLLEKGDEVKVKLFF